MKKREKPELLVPAGSLENLKIAVNYGADAVYIGGEQFGLRSKARNFSDADMLEGIAYAHAKGVQVYVTANIIAHNEDIYKVEEYFLRLNEIGPDAIIVADVGIFAIAKEVLDEKIQIHMSTQGNHTNYASINYWKKQGVDRIVVARELSLEEIKRINEKTNHEIEIEAFVHGAMCISYSGRCLLSNYMSKRDANRGECNHPCRWTYHLMEETRPGEYMPVYEDEHGTYIYNSKDLCMIEHIDKLVDAGIDSFKIEGRMKTGLYVATVTGAYRKAIDTYFANPEEYDANRETYLKEVKKCSYRKFTTGFYYEKPTGEEQVYDSNTYVRDYVFVGRVLEDTEKSEQKSSKDEQKMLTKIEQRNKFVVGDTIELMKTDGSSYSFVVEELYNEDMEIVESAPHPKQVLYLEIPVDAREYELLRKQDIKEN